MVYKTRKQKKRGQKKSRGGGIADYFKVGMLTAENQQEPCSDLSKIFGLKTPKHKEIVYNQIIESCDKIVKNSYLEENEVEENEVLRKVIMNRLSKKVCDDANIAKKQMDLFKKIMLCLDVEMLCGIKKFMDNANPDLLYEEMKYN